MFCVQRVFNRIIQQWGWQLCETGGFCTYIKKERAMCESRKISSLETKRKPAFKDWNSIWKWLSQKKRRENTSLCWTVTAAPALYIEGSCFSPWHLHVNGYLVLGDSREGPQVASLEICWWLERQYGTWWANVLILDRIALCTFCSVIMDVTFLLLPQCFMVLFFFFPGLFFVLPCTDSITKVDMRTISFDIPPQEVCIPFPGLPFLGRDCDLVVEHLLVVPKVPGSTSVIYLKGPHTVNASSIHFGNSIGSCFQVKLKCWEIPLKTFHIMFGFVPLWALLFSR